MKITASEIYLSRIRLKKPFIISLGRFDYAENVMVIIRTDQGISGYGECSPFMSINGESAETCLVVGQYLARALKGSDPLMIEPCAALMDATIYGNSSIKSAFNMALYDIASRHAGVPLYTFLGGKQRKTVVTDYTVSLGSPEEMATDAGMVRNRGFQVIKVKLGNGGEKDVERIRMIRKAIGMEIPLRIDANQGWDTGEAIATLNALFPYHIQFCEEPVPRWNYSVLPRIRKESPVPVMADESCCDHHDARRLAALEACDSFNIKLGKSSGITNALKIIRIAEESGITMQIGGFLESRLGFTAASHLAMVSDQILYIDFDTPLMFVDDPVTGGISYDDQGVISLPDSPGLGAAIDETFLRKMKKKVI